MASAFALLVLVGITLAVSTSGEVANGCFAEASVILSNVLTTDMTPTYNDGEIVFKNLEGVEINPPLSCVDIKFYHVKPEDKSIVQCHTHGLCHQAYGWGRQTDPRWTKEQALAYLAGYDNKEL